MKVNRRCKKCGELFIYADEMIEHIYAEHNKLANCSPQEMLDNFEALIPNGKKQRRNDDNVGEGA